jgi:hypothetical protein
MGLSFSTAGPVSFAARPFAADLFTDLENFICAALTNS